MSKKLTLFIELGPQGGESTSHQEIIQWFSESGRLCIATISCLSDAFPYDWGGMSSSRMLNWALMCCLRWSRLLQPCWDVWLLVWRMLRSGINLRCNPSMLNGIIGSFLSTLEPLISFLYAWSKELYTISSWCHSQTARSGTSATRLTWILATCVTCRVLDSMLEGIIAVIYRNLISVYSGCFNFCNRCCANLCIMNVSRD